MPATEYKTTTRRLMIVAALLCLSGVAVSVELTRIHVFVHTDPNYHSICAMSEGVNCETVAASPYSVFAGLPVSVWGIAGYLLMAVLALWGASTKRPHPTWPLGFLLSLTAFSVLMSAVLALISATRIDSFCLFCMGSYGINVALLAICAIALKRTHTRVLDVLLFDLSSLIARPIMAGLMPLLGIFAIVMLQVLVPPYWKTPGWTDLPKLAFGTDNSGHHWIGAKNPVLTIIEFSDYECPHCRAAHKETRVLAAKHPDKIRLVHRHLPLDMSCHPGVRRAFHAHACTFAEAAECAGLQGHFWEMNDALFSIQETVKTNNVDAEDLAVRLGLNRSEFKDCLTSHMTATRIKSDIQEAMERELTGTPSFLIGDRLFMGRIPEAEISRLIEVSPSPSASGHHTGSRIAEHPQQVSSDPGETE